MYEFKRFTLSQSEISFLTQQLDYSTIRVVGCNTAGEPLYGYDAADGSVHELGLLGSFNPLDIPAGATIWYYGARDPIGQNLLLEDPRIDQAALMALDTNIALNSFDANNPFCTQVTYADTSVKAPTDGLP